MADTMQRQWAMLKMIPKSPRKIDTHTLHSQLAGMGYPNRCSLPDFESDINSRLDGVACQLTHRSPQEQEFDMVFPTQIL